MSWLPSIMWRMLNRKTSIEACKINHCQRLRTKENMNKMSKKISGGGGGGEEELDLLAG